MIQIDTQLTAARLKPVLDRLFEVAAPKILALDSRWATLPGSPVFTVEGKYTARGWTEWTQGFQFGSALLVYEVNGDARLLEIGRGNTLRRMAGHLTHIGVHDHGFNNVSTYGNLLRLIREGIIPDNEWERHFYTLALKVTGAVQAARWTDLGEGAGYIHSFNGPHSLFSDTIRSLRALALAHSLGHVLMGEKDRPIDLLSRLLAHAATTARYNVYFGTGRDAYDLRGRVVHESIFNLNDGSYRCPSSQQGYSPFTTWTRGLAWILCGYAELAEFLVALPEASLAPHGGRDAVLVPFIETARATADFYIESTPADGIPYWDTGAPGLVHLGNYPERPAEPYNTHEPVDSSAAVIAAQGLLRLGRYLRLHGQPGSGERYYQAGLTVARTVLSEPYLSTDPAHEGLIVHSVYHRPNGWDHIPAGREVPCGESSMWGDYHAHELALLLRREAMGRPYLTFFNALTNPS